MSDQKNINNVSFQVGEDVYMETLQHAFEVAYFIEQCHFPVISATFNGIVKNAGEAIKFTEYVGPTFYVSQFKKHTPDRMQEILGVIAWYQDMYDNQMMREAERLSQSEKIFSTGHDF